MGFFSKTLLPPPPKEPQIADFQSYVTSVQRKAVKGPDGKTTIIENELLTPKEQEIKDNYLNIMQQQLKKINNLASGFAPEEIPNFQEEIDNFTNNHLAFIENNYQSNLDSMEKNFAKYGLSDSSSALQARNNLMQIKHQAQNNISNQLDEFTKGKKQEILNNSLMLYNIADSALNQKTSASLDNLAIINSLQNSHLSAQNSYNQMLNAYSQANANMENNYNKNIFSFLTMPKNLTSLL